MIDEKPPIPQCDPDDAASEPSGDGGPRGFVADAVKKALLAGVGALFLTEEGARKLARDWKLPKEVIGYVVGQAQSAKDELLRVFSDEFRRFLESDALRREFLRALTAMSIEVKAEIRLKQVRPDKVKPSVRASVRPKLVRREGEEG